MFFLGAGASRADGLPLTSEIIYGVASQLLNDSSRYEAASKFLDLAFHIKDDAIDVAAGAWNDFVNNAGAFSALANIPMPDIVEVLSLLDVLITDESTIAGQENDSGRLEALGPRDLSRAREQFGRAVAASLSEVAKIRHQGALARTFVEALTPDDVVITTNWDLLLDSELDRRHGTCAEDIGSDVIISGSHARASSLSSSTGQRAPLFKLHGSLNWLTCFRCTRLYVNPQEYTAALGFYRSARKPSNTCRCGLPLRSTLIVPTFFKQYRNRHLANIWARAQEQLSDCKKWYFIGYSLPSDDVHIRAFLLRAFHMRRDAGHSAPQATIVTIDADKEVLRRRYGFLFGTVRVDHTGFAAFAARLRS